MAIDATVEALVIEFDRRKHEELLQKGSNPSAHVFSNKDSNEARFFGLTSSYPKAHMFLHKVSHEARPFGLTGSCPNAHTFSNSLSHGSSFFFFLIFNQS